MFDNFKNICAASCGVCARAAADCSAEGLTHSALLPAACWLGCLSFGLDSGQCRVCGTVPSRCLPAGCVLFEPYLFSRIEGPLVTLHHRVEYEWV